MRSYTPSHFTISELLAGLIWEVSREESDIEHLALHGETRGFVGCDILSINSAKLSAQERHCHSGYAKASLIDA